VKTSVPIAMIQRLKRTNRLTEPILLDTPLNKRIPSEKRKIKGMRTAKISAIRQKLSGNTPKSTNWKGKSKIAKTQKHKAPNKKGKDA